MEDYLALKRLGVGNNISVHSIMVSSVAESRETYIHDIIIGLNEDNGS